jgi:hypothetical protein
MLLSGGWRGPERGAAALARTAEGAMRDVVPPRVAPHACGEGGRAMHRVPRFARLLALLPILGCGTAAPPLHTVELPIDAVVGAGDPARAAIIGSAYAFGAPASLARRPDAAARAVAEVEYLAVEIPAGPRWVEFAPHVGQELVGARAELRRTLGIAPQAPPQAVVDALYGAARALRAGDAEAAERLLARLGLGEGRTTLARLADLPPLPRTRIATSLANLEMNRVDQDSRFGGAGASDGGKD